MTLAACLQEPQTSLLSSIHCKVSTKHDILRAWRRDDSLHHPWHPPPGLRQGPSIVSAGATDLAALTHSMLGRYTILDPEGLSRRFRPVSRGKPRKVSISSDILSTLPIFFSLTVWSMSLVLSSLLHVVCLFARLHEQLRAIANKQDIQIVLNVP